MRDAAGELGTEHGDPVAEFGAEALPADLDIDAGSAAELDQAHQRGDDPLAALLLGRVGEQGQFGDLVDQEHDRHRPQVLRQAPQVGGDLPIRSVRADPLFAPDHLIRLRHPFHECFEEVGGGVGVVGQGGEPAGERGEFHTLLAVDTDQGDVLRGEFLDQVALVDGLPRLRRAEVQRVRHLLVVAVEHLPVLPQRDRYPQPLPLDLGGHLHPRQDVVAGHPQLDHTRLHLTGGDAVHRERVPQPVRGGGEVESVLTGLELEPQHQTGTGRPHPQNPRRPGLRRRPIRQPGQREAQPGRRNGQPARVHDRGVAEDDPHHGEGDADAQPVPGRAQPPQHQGCDDGDQDQAEERVRRHDDQPLVGATSATARNAIPNRFSPLNVFSQSRALRPTTLTGMPSVIPSGTPVSGTETV